MPRVLSASFGELEYAESSVILFPRGLPGFESSRRFLLLHGAGLAPLVHLQSLEHPGLCFVALPAHVIVPGYALRLRDEDRALIPEADPALVLALLAAEPDGGWTANLMAPIVIHLPTRIAVQAVRSDLRYSHRHRLEELAAC